MKRHDTVILEALRRFGPQQQEQMLIGEIGELLCLFGRRSQGRDTEEDWLSEIADATIMLRQLAHIHGVEKVDVMIDAKIRRLQTRLEA